MFSTMAKKYKSAALAALHETVQDFHGIGLIDALTMREFNESSIAKVETLVHDEIIETRNKAGVS